MNPLAALTGAFADLSYVIPMQQPALLRRCMIRMHMIVAVNILDQLVALAASKADHSCTG